MGDLDLATVWVLGDQLSRRHGPLGDSGPGDCRVLFVESAALVRGQRWHRQRLHLVLSAMRHLAEELRAEGFDVDYRRSADLAAGLAAHRADHPGSRVLAARPSSIDGCDRLTALGVELVDHDYFLTAAADFADWAGARTQLRMEDFYRWQRRRLDVLMDGDEPAGGDWNFDHDNRERPPKDGRSWPGVTRFELDEIDHAVLAGLDADPEVTCWGDGPDGLWPVTREQALVRLGEFVEHALAPFGPHEDAMLAGEWKLAHSVLSSSLNLGLLHPDEVVRAVEVRYREGGAPINSVEGFIRQVIGWREYVWCLYWYWGADYRTRNAHGAHRPVPPSFTGEASTEMACVEATVAGLHARAYGHHIQRLMVLGNLALTAGVEPWALSEWMRVTFIDGAEWVMVPNVIGMALHADGGEMATKPYASGGAYLNRMSDYCRDCRFDPAKRTGENACPFTSLYWDFLARNEADLATNHRMARQLAGMRRLSDLDATRVRAAEVLERLDRGEL
ncbi:MAG: cryptochrome/photolyase family protein [Acidimicrobiales bacterium]